MPADQVILPIFEPGEEEEEEEEEAEKKQEKDNDTLIPSKPPSTCDKVGKVVAIIAWILLGLWISSAIIALGLYFGAREECGWISPPYNPCVTMPHSNKTVCRLSKRDVQPMTKCEIIDKTMGVFGWIFVIPILILFAIGVAGSPLFICAFQ